AGDVNARVRKGIARNRDEVHDHGGSVRTALGNDLPPVLGDRIQLQQVLLNLIVNAIEEMIGGDQAPRELTMTSMPAAADTVLITVADSGPGLSPTSRDRLFEAFHTTKPQGMGMGLAISRAIVEA